MKGRFDAIKYSRSLEKQLSAEPPRKKKLHEDLAKLRARIAEAEKGGLDVRALNALIDEAAAALEKNDHQRAEELLAAVEKQLSETLQAKENAPRDQALAGDGTAGMEEEKGSLEELLEAAHETVSEVELLGVDVSKAEKLLAEARTKRRTDESTARILAISARREAERSRQSIISEALSFAEGLVTESAAWGMEVTELKAMLGQMVGMAKSGDFGSAIGLADSLRDDIDKRRRVFFRAVLGRVLSGLEQAKAAGTDAGRLDNLLQMARTAIDSRDYETAFEILRQVEESALPEKKAVPEPGETLEELVARAVREGLSSSELKPELDRISKLREAADTVGLQKAELELRQKVEGQLKDRSDVAGLLDRTRALLASSAKMGMEVKEFSARLEKAADHLKNRRQADAVALAQKVLAELTEKQKGLSESVIASLEGDISSLRKLGAPAEAPESALKQARRAVEEAKYEEGFMLARRTLDEIEAVKEQFGSYDEAIRRCERLLAAGKEQLIDCSMAEPLMARAHNALGAGRLAEAAENAARAAELLGSTVLGRASESVQGALAALDKADKEGAVVEDAEKLALEVLTNSERGDLAATQHAIEELQQAVDGQTRVCFDARDALQKAEETVAEALLQELNLTAERARLEEAHAAYERGEYESARYHAVDLTPSLSLRCREAHERAMLIANSLVQELGQSGVVIPRTREYLRRAKELAECGRFGLGHSYAVLAAEEAEAVGERHRAALEARGMVESMLEASRELGVPAGELEAASAEVGRLIDKHEYEHATRLSGETLDKLDALFAQNARARCDAFAKLISEAQLLKLETAAGAAALLKAHEHVKKNEFPEALSSIRAPMEALAGRKALCEGALSGLQAAGQRLDEAESLGLTTGELRRRLAAAARLQASGELEKTIEATKELQEGARQLIAGKATALVDELRRALAEIGKTGTLVADLVERAEAMPAAISSGALADVFKEVGAIRDVAALRRKRFVESAERLSRLQARIEESKGIGAEAGPAEDLMGLARYAAERGNYDDVLDYVERAEGELLSAAEAALAALRDRLIKQAGDLTKAGVELQAVSRALAEAPAAAADHQYRAAYDGLKKLETEMGVRHEQFQNAQKVLAAAEARITEAGESGVTVSEASGLLDSARKAAAAGDYPKAAELAERGRQVAAHNIESHQQAVGALEQARAHASEAEAMGADMARAGELLKQAEAALAAGKYDEAMGRVGNYEEELVRSKRALVREAAALARKALDEAAKINARTDRAKELLARAEAAEQAHDFNGAFKLAQESSELARQGQQRHMAALGALSEVQKLVQDARSEGLRIDGLMHALDEASGALSRFDYDLCMKAAERCRRDAEELLKAVRSARRELERCFSDLASSRDVGADPGRLTNLATEARAAFESGDYAGARQRAADCHERLAELQHDAVWAELGGALLELEGAAEQGAEVSGAYGLVEAAGLALAEGNYRGAQENMRRGLSVLAEERRKFDEVSSALMMGRTVLEEARALEADVMVASDLSAEATEALSNGDYAGARKLATQATEEAQRSQRTILSQLSAIAERSVSEAEGSGILCRVPRDRLARAKAQLELQDFKGASDCLEECDKALSQVIYDHNTAAERKSDIAEALLKAEELGMDLAASRQDAAAAEELASRGNYGQALATYDKTLSELAGAECMFVAGRIMDIGHQLEAAVAQGMEAKREAEALERASAELDNDVFLANDLASGAARDLEAHRKEFKRLGELAGSFEEGLARAQGLGVDISEAREALKKGRALIAKGSYGDAEEVLQRGGAALDGRLAAAMADRLEGLRRDIRSKEAEGVKAPKAAELLNEADRSFRSKDYPEMLRRLEQCAAELAAQEKGRRSMASGVEEMVRLLAGMEALGADTSKPFGLASRAKELGAEGDYQQSLKLLEEAKAAVEEAERSRILDLMAAAGAAANEGEALGADVQSARKLLADANKSLEAGDRHAAAEAVRKALEEAGRSTAVHQKHLELLASLERSIAEGEGSGLNMERARRGLDEARKGLLKHDYDSCSATVEKTRRDLDLLIKQSSEARRIIAFCEKKADAARRIGAEVGSAEALLAEAKAATEKRLFVKAFESATRCLKDLDDKMRSMVMGFLTDAEVQLADLEEAGADVGEEHELMEVAMEGLNENEFEKAIELARQALEGARAKHAQEEDSAETLRELERRMKDTSEMGGDVRNVARMVEKAHRTLAAHDLARLGTLVRDGLETLNGVLQELVAERTSEASSVLSLVEEMGVGVSKSRDRILRARRALECGDHKSALNLIEDAVKAAEDSRRRHMDVMEEVRALQAMTREGAELGLDISGPKRALDEVEVYVDEGFYNEAVKIMGSARQELEKGYMKRAEEALARTEEALGRARQFGAQVAPEEKGLAESRDLFKQGQYQLVLKQCLEMQRRMDEKVSEYIAEVILGAENLLAVAAKIGVDAHEFKTELERAEESVGDGNYGPALELATEVLEKTRALLKSSVSGTISALGELIDESKKIGAAADEGEEYSNMALSALDRREYEVAHDHALSGMAAVDRIREEFIVRRRGEVEKELRDAEEQGVQVEDQKRSVEKVPGLLEQSDFESAAQVLAEVEETVLERQERFASDSLQKAEEALGRVEMDVDLSKARSLLEEGRGALNEGEYEEAVDCAKQSGEEAKRVQFEFVSEVISSTEETLGVAAEMGADTRRAAELLDRAQADLQAANYDNALDAIIQCSDEAERAQYEFVRGPIETIRKVMREAKLSDERIKRLVSSAEQLLEKKEYAEARREVLRGLELTGAIQEKQVRHAIFDAEEVLAAVEKAGARSPSARNSISNALKALDSKDYERAMNNANECTALAKKAKEEHLAAEKSLKAAESEMATLSEVKLAPEEVTDLLELAQHEFSVGDYPKARDFAQKAVEMAGQSYVKSAQEALSSSQFKINYAKNIGADVSEAENLLKQAKAAAEAKDHHKTIVLARRCREEAELAKKRYTELADTIYSADSKISVANTYGLDTSAARKLLDQAVANKSRNGEEALDFARQSMEEVQRALERFAPDLKIDIKLEGILQKEKWSQATLSISNAGKATGKDISVRFSGDIEVQGSEKVPILRGGESRKQSVRVRPTKGGDLPLGMSVGCLREFDSKEFKSQETRWIKVEDVAPLTTPLNQFVTKSVRCHICLGTIKSGLPLVRCECGKTYHETCASRVGECPNCGRDLRNQARAEGR